MADYDHDVIGVGNPDHPANQTENSNSIKWIVNLDDMSDSFEFDDLSDAETKFDEIIGSTEIEFEKVSIDKWNEYDTTIKEATASELFLMAKKAIYEIKASEEIPFGEPCSDERQRVRTAKEFLFNLVR